MIWLDAFFRFASVGMILMTAVLAVRDLPKSTPSVLLLITMLCLLGLFLGHAPPVFELPVIIRQLFRITDVFLLSAVWLFVLALFRHDFTVKVWHVLVATVLAGSMLMERLVLFGWLDGLPGWWPYLIYCLSFSVVTHMLAVVVLGRKDDLLEKRRNSRIYVVLIIAFCVTLNIVLGSMLWQEHQSTINVVSLFPAIVVMNGWLLGITPGTFTFKPKTAEQAIELSARDRQLQQQLQRVLEEERGYLQANLTIDKLASQLGVGAPRLRSFINLNLGFNNFSSYINGYRIEAIKVALKNPENAHIPILTVALNHGFNSLAPFNRAFKKVVGMTPSEYRKKA